ncbi:DUF892 family protein [Haloferula sargassicola]|uniref:DUF892 family protein n=1 Tax=Haloferula sargassicola TaxID=490096 RepID=A0ABP9UJV3_9BACT
MSRHPGEELTHFLGDLYSIELQALAQLETAPNIAGDAAFAADLKKHHAETEVQAERVRNRLEALGGSPSAVKEAIMKLGGKGFLLFAKMQSETPGRLLVHSYSYEAMEWAGYQALKHLAQLNADEETASLARAIGSEEKVMLDRLGGRFSTVEEDAHGETPAEDLPDHVRTHLAEAHALLKQSATLLDQGTESSRSELAGTYRRGAELTQAELKGIERRLEELGSSPSVMEDAAMKLGGLNWSAFFHSQTDTPMKLLCFAFAVEHLVIGALELLQRTAQRAEDHVTATLCEHLITEKRQLAESLRSGIGASVEATVA